MVRNTWIACNPSSMFLFTALTRVQPRGPWGSSISTALAARLQLEYCEHAGREMVVYEGAVGRPSRRLTDQKEGCPDSDGVVASSRAGLLLSGILLGSRLSGSLCGCFRGRRLRG